MDASEMEIVGPENDLRFPRLLVYGRQEIAMYLRLRNERRCAYRHTGAKSLCVSLLCTNWCCFGAPYNGVVRSRFGCVGSSSQLTLAFTVAFFGYLYLRRNLCSRCSFSFA